MRPLRVLNVAEKNDAAKELSRIMSRGQSSRVGIGRQNRVLGGGWVGSYYFCGCVSRDRFIILGTFDLYSFFQ